MGNTKIPEIIHLYPTMKCPLKCSYCYVEEVNKDNREMSIQQYEKIIEEACDLGIKGFDIAGGEPFLYKDIIELLSIIKRKNAKSKLVSNGLFLDRYFEAFSQTRGLIEELHISLDSASEGLQDSIRGLPGLHRKTTQNIREYINKDLGPVKINYVLQRSSFEYLNSMLEFALELGAKGIDIQCVADVSSKTKGNSFSLKVTEIIDSLYKIFKWRDNLGTHGFEIVIALPSYIYPAMVKQRELSKKREGIKMIYFPGLLTNNAFKEAVIIRHNGDVTGSTTFFNNPEWFIGNLGKATLTEIWDKGAKAMRDRIVSRSKELMVDGICKDCPAKRYCRGGDPVAFSDISKGQECPFKMELKGQVL